MSNKGLLYTAPMLLVLGGFFLIPLMALCGYSFVGHTGGPSLENYAAFVQDPFSFHVLVATARLAGETLAATTLAGLPVALLYWHAGPRLRASLIFLTLMPMLTGNAVKTFAWVVILGRHGPVNEALIASSLVDRPVRLLFTELGVVLAMCQMNLPLIILPLIAVYSRTDRRLTEAAEISGAGPWRIFATVLLPIAVPALLAGWTLVFASTSASFLAQTVIGGARHIYMAQLIYREVGVLFDWPLAATISVVLLTSTALLLLGIALVGRNRRFTTHV
jgi:putative spermidine/putrescine transport system permease protein